MKRVFKTKRSAEQWARANLTSDTGAIMTILHKGNKPEIEELGHKWLKSPQWILNYRGINYDPLAWILPKSLR